MLTKALMYCTGIDRHTVNNNKIQINNKTQILEKIVGINFENKIKFIEHICIIYNRDFSQLRICRPPPLPLLSFDPIFMEDAQCAESNEK